MDKEVIQISNLDSNSTISKKKFNILSLFTGKNLKIIILSIIVLIALIMFIGISDNTTSTKDSSLNEDRTYQTTLEYCKQIENKLETLLSQIDGAGQVKVMITVDGSPELVYASDTDTKTSSNSNGTTSTSSSSLIIVSGNGNSNALILTENLPAVKGVIIVSSGASNISIKLDILNAVSTLLDISTDQISVLKGI